LNERQRRVFDDHAACDCLQLTIADGPRAAYVVVRRRVVHRERLARWLPVRGRIPLSEILHCSAPEILARHLERAKAGILARQRTLGLVADARLFSVAPRGLPMKEYTLYRSPVFEARDIDRLYSELVLVPI
jgi:acetoacetyl-CoA synthetase